MQVRCVPEEKDTADALRSVVPELQGKYFILISGDLVGDVSVKVNAEGYILSYITLYPGHSLRAWDMGWPFSMERCIKEGPENLVTCTLLLKKVGLSLCRGG